MRAFLFIVSMVLCLLSSGVSGQEKTPDLDPVYDWLELIDRGRFFQSWQYAGDLFKEQIEASEWDKALKSVRTPLGSIQSRNLSAMSVREELPGLPKGKYVVIQFSTSFESKAGLTETLILDDNADTVKVIGYFIK
jgi:hypothetical protein